MSQAGLRLRAIMFGQLKRAPDDEVRDESQAEEYRQQLVERWGFTPAFAELLWNLRISPDLIFVIEEGENEK